jgi:hypothetical protein
MSLPPGHTRTRFFCTVTSQVGGKQDWTAAAQLRPQQSWPDPHGQGSLPPTVPQELYWVGGETLIPLAGSRQDKGPDEIGRGGLQGPLFPSRLHHVVGGGHR